MSSKSRVTRKYSDRKAEFVSAAIPLINRRGVSGMTLADVAGELGLAPKAVAYYFKKKEDLAAACFLRGIARTRECIAAAAHGETAEDRVSLFLQAYFELRRRAAHGEVDDLTSPNDIRALGSPEVSAAFADMFRELRGLLQEDKSGDRYSLSARAHLLMSHCHWSGFWLPSILPDRYGYFEERLASIVLDGIASEGFAFEPKAIAPLIPSTDPAGETANEMFLRAATELINEQGYHGASVDRISARLNVTKGAFYHHVESKDELILACFERTLAVLRRAIAASEAASSNGLQTLATFATALTSTQFSGVGLLLRMSALTTLPEALQAPVVAKYSPIINLLASLVSDGIADGSIRPVNPNLAAEAIMGMINSADELPAFAPGISTEQAGSYYVRPCFVGLSLRPS